MSVSRGSPFATNMANAPAVSEMRSSRTRIARTTFARTKLASWNPPKSFVYPSRIKTRGVDPVFDLFFV